MVFKDSFYRVQELLIPVSEIRKPSQETSTDVLGLRHRREMHRQCTNTSWSINTLGAACPGKPGGTAGWEAGHEAAVPACSPESQTHPGLCHKQHGQQVKGGDSPSLLWDPIWSAVSSSGVPTTRRTCTYWSSEEGHEVDQRDEAPLLWGNTEKIAIVQPHIFIHLIFFN